jgi:hypothetical protein
MAFGHARARAIREQYETRLAQEAQRQADKWEFEEFCRTQRLRLAGKLRGSAERILRARYGEADGGEMQLAETRK